MSPRTDLILDQNSSCTPILNCGIGRKVLGFSRLQEVVKSHEFKVGRNVHLIWIWRWLLMTLWNTKYSEWMHKRWLGNSIVPRSHLPHNLGSSYQCLRATSHTRLRAHDQYTSSTLIGGKRRSRSRFAAHYAWGTNGGSMWMPDGCKVYMDPYVALNGSCFMVTWTIFKNCLLE